MKGDVAGVRILPPVIEFLDTELNTVQRAEVTVKNISTVSKSIRYYDPQRKVSACFITVLIMFISLWLLMIDVPEIKMISIHPRKSRQYGTQGHV